MDTSAELQWIVQFFAPSTYGARKKGLVEKSKDCQLWKIINTWLSIIVSTGCHWVRWILWFTLGSATAAAVCRDFTRVPTGQGKVSEKGGQGKVREFYFLNWVGTLFTVTPLEAAIFQLSFLNLGGMFLVIRACLGIFLGSFRKKNMAATALFMSKNAIS